VASSEPAVPAEQEDQRFELGIAARGVLMGLAEVVPGVSGGTMAFITGIYGRLIAALASFGPASIGMLFRPLEFIRHHHIGFLGSLALGMIVGVLFFARVMKSLIEHYPPVVWAFFAGVILMSVVVIGSARSVRRLALWAPLGMIAGLALLWIPINPTQAGLFEVFLGGAVAVCAWILPAVSGSYMLLILGLYEQVLTAVAELDVMVLFALLSGCAVGLLLFVQLLAWVLKHHEDVLMSFLTGFMAGSIVKLWPWQVAGEAAAQTDALQRLMTPANYAAAGAHPYVLLACGAFACGAVGLWWLNKITHRQ